MTTLATEFDVGLHPGTSFGRYRQIDACNWSMLKTYLRSPAHAYYAQTHPSEPTPSMQLGDAVHAAVLEPDRFAADYAKAPNVDLRTKAGKAELAEFESGNANKVILRGDDYEQCLRIRDAVWSHDKARRMLQGRGGNEIAAVWVDLGTGLRCKGRLDRLTYADGVPTIIDLKTTSRGGSVDAFSKEIANYQYHGQAAFYLDGLAAISAADRAWRFIVVETFEPYVVSQYMLAPDSIEEGRKLYRRALTQHKKCNRAGEWPGYAEDGGEIHIPQWAVSPEDDIV